VTLALARLAADAVLYEGYLLYPYRSTAAKNQVRWQFGVLGPPGAASAGLGEEDDLAVECLLRPDDERGRVTVHLRFLQLQRRQVERADGTGGYSPVAELRTGGEVWTTWDEAVEIDRVLGTFSASDLRRGLHLVVQADAAEEMEALPSGRLVRRRWPLSARVALEAAAEGAVLRLRVAVRNTGARAADKDDAVRSSLIGTHLLMSATDARFVSVIDPPDDARDAAGRCRQHRCWPVLAGDGGPDGQTSDVVLAAPIILSDHPAVAPESSVAMFDSTEIDEILTLRVMTLTDEEKAQARATDPRAAAIIDRCEQLSPTELQRLHGIMRDPRGIDPVAAGTLLTGDDWWGAEAAGPVSPETDAVVVAGIAVQRGSRVLLQPNRRADAQDMFLAGQEAVVSAVHVDLDGETHVAVTLVDDPAAELHDWYGRHLYFAPDELRPLAGTGRPDQREETSS
jgi:hypothetical protein